MAATSRERHGGPPYFWFAEIKAPTAGSWHATLTPQQAGAGCGPITREIKVRPDKPGGPGSAASTWPLRNVWNRASENLISAWIEKLFDDPLDSEPSWRALHEVVVTPRATSRHTVEVIPSGKASPNRHNGGDHVEC